MQVGAHPGQILGGRLRFGHRRCGGLGGLGDAADVVADVLGAQGGVGNVAGDLGGGRGLFLDGGGDGRLEFADPGDDLGDLFDRVHRVDGKTLRGARRLDGSQVHLLSALNTSTGIVLAQVTISAKSNEIPAFAPLLDAIEQVLGSLKDLLFVADALHTQTAHANEIAARGAHLLIPVKGNRPNLHTQLKTLPWTQIPIGNQTRDHGHGRSETRTVKAITLHTPAGSASRTRNRRSGSPEPAPQPPAAKLPAKPPT